MGKKDKFQHSPFSFLSLIIPLVARFLTAFNHTNFPLANWKQNWTTIQISGLLGMVLKKYLPFYKDPK
jgi:hypothetical protein